MSDQADPSATDNQQADGAADTANPAGSTPASTPDSGAPGQSPTTDWEGRYNGAMRVLSQRDKQIEDLQAQLDAASGSVGDLTQQLETAQAGAAAKEQSLAEQLTTVTPERDEANQELTTARAELLKFNALKEHPELLPLADAIPALPDEQAMADYLKMMADGVTEIATQKAEQLTAGMTPGPVAPANQPAYNFASLGEWQTALNQAAGTDEFAKIAQAFRQWEAKQS